MERHRTVLTDRPEELSIPQDYIAAAHPTTQGVMLKACDNMHECKPATGTSFTKDGK